MKKINLLFLSSVLGALSIIPAHAMENEKELSPSKRRASMTAAAPDSILVVEDNRIGRRLIPQTLKQLGFKVHPRVVSNAQDLRDVLAADISQIAVILMDYNLKDDPTAAAGDQNGVMLTQIVRDFDSLHKPVIIAHSDDAREPSQSSSSEMRSNNQQIMDAYFPDHVLYVVKNPTASHYKKELAEKTSLALQMINNHSHTPTQRRLFVDQAPHSAPTTPAGLGAPSDAGMGSDATDELVRRLEQTQLR